MPKKLLFSVTIKDCEVQTFRGSGPGGQNRNKVNSGVRIIHHPSGAITQSCETRDQFRNKRFAWERLAKHPKFLAWHKMEVARRRGELDLNAVVDAAMADSNIRIEVKDEKDHWSVVDLNELNEE